MSNILARSLRFSLLGVLFVLFVASISAQPGPIGPGTGNLRLREALDYDHDGKADYTIFRPSDANWYILQSGGGVKIQNWGLPTDDFFTPGDYDGDGKGDISVFRDSTGDWFRINSSDSTVTIVNWGISGDEPVARDYDGDGKTDIAVVRRTNGNMIWFVLKAGGAYDAIQWGISSDFTAPGDYDGDGKFDLSIQRPGATPTSQSTFYVLNSGGGVTVFDWGISSDFTVAGDYDGDGKTDFAVVRGGSTFDSPLVWYIYQSHNNTPVIVTWGVTGDDLTCQNDYDGDGATDIAIWRNSTGDFWVLKSLGGVINVNWGTANDFPVAGYDTH